MRKYLESLVNVLSRWEFGSQRLSNWSLGTCGSPSSAAEWQGSSSGDSSKEDCLLFGVEDILRLWPFPGTRR